MDNKEILDDEKPEEPKESTGIFGWASVILSIVFIFKGFNYINKDMVTWGSILIIGG